MTSSRRDFLRRFVAGIGAAIVAPIPATRAQTPLCDMECQYPVVNVTPDAFEPIRVWAVTSDGAVYRTESLCADTPEWVKVDQVWQ